MINDNVCECVAGDFEVTFEKEMGIFRLYKVTYFTQSCMVEIYNTASEYSIISKAIARFNSISDVKLVLKGW